MLARLTRHVEPIVQGQKNDVRIASMPHLVLLGDSIFDNAHYTSGGPDVVSQVRNLLPLGWGASLLAVDGSTTVNICQLNRSMQHFVEVYWREFEILRFFLDADLTAAPLGPARLGCIPTGRFF